jgi:hypothetical protein
MTLLETVTAIVLSFAVISLGARMLGAVGDQTDRIEAARVAGAMEANGERTLRELLAQAESFADSTREFRGEVRSLDCWSWCLTSHGYAARCSVSVSIDSLRDSSIVMAQLGDGRSFVARRDSGTSSLRYVDAASSDSSWRSHWRSSVTLPMALALITSRDTVIYPLGPSRE